MKAVQPGRIQPQAATEAPRGHEPSHIQISWFIAVLVFAGFSAVVIHAGVWGWLKSLQGKTGIDAARAFTYRTPLTGRPVPYLQIQPQSDWRSFQEKENKILNSYSWVDRSNGVVRIPINEAIDRLVARGMPRWGTNNGAISALQLQQARSEEGQR